MGKTSPAADKKASPPTDTEKAAVEKLKYEVAQEMGIHPQTKNKKS